MIRKSFMLLLSQVCQARIFDFKRKFIEAAQKYLELSNFIADPEERSYSLAQAVTCAILANAGPQRARLLASLYKDERVQKVSAHLYQLLERVFLERLLEPKAVAAFAQTLKPHQLALLPDG